VGVNGNPGLRVTAVIAGELENGANQRRPVSKHPIPKHLIVKQKKSPAVCGALNRGG
jgi:hypothetical protein